MENFEKKLDKYAELAVKMAVNLQQDQLLVIEAPIEAAYFVRKVAVKAYEAGAKNVHVEWNDEEMHLIKLTHAPFDTLKEFPLWKAKGFEEMAREGAAILYILGSNPDLLKDVSPERAATFNKAYGTAMQDFRRYTQNGIISWSAIAVSSKAWASKVFPGLDEATGIEMLWENIFKITRVDHSDPVKAWKEHIENLKNKLDYLNEKKYRKLYFKAPGTDISMELPENHLWIGGGITNEKGIFFVPDMPTEEVFTTPLKYSVNGTVAGTKPLNCGNLIENFTLTFKEGRIVDFTAEKGYEALKKLIETDEGSHYLGEVALVPHNSLVSDTNIIFYNNLIDENAANHFALGAAYPFCIEDGSTMTKKELEKAGANTSLVHEDFIIGSSDMEVYGETADGMLESIFN